VTTGPAGPARANLYAALALIAVMVIGGAAGYALGRRSPRMRPGADMTLLGISRSMLLDSLRLSPTQRIRINGLLDDAARRADSAVGQLMTDLRAVTDQTRQQVQAALDGPQKARFDSIMSAARPVRMRTPVPPRRP
jgi:hypothetical protein